jgi:predicted ATPase
MNEDNRMRIRSIEVNNFKSLVKFELNLAKFSCLIGLNGVGKSTVLQFIDFLSQLVRGDVKGWLEERQWKPRDVRSKLLKKKNVEFHVHFQDDNGEPAGHWEGHYNPWENRCTWERINALGYVLEIDGNEIRVETDLQESRQRANRQTYDWRDKLRFDYQGSIFSSVKDNVIPESFRRCSAFFQDVESLDLLTPERLRQRTRSANGTLGHGGRNLSAFVYELGPEGRMALAKTLKKAYPQLKYVNATSLRSGWKQLQASEAFNGVKLLTEARHLNDGLLRMIAILAEVNSEHGFLLFDEIENGINPELVEFVIDILVKAKQQVVVTTHSPMILNYLDDMTAKKGVIYIYKTPEGHTKSIRFFSIPSLKKKLEVMGPGEAFVDTNLTELADEIAEVTKEEQ